MLRVRYHYHIISIFNFLLPYPSPYLSQSLDTQYTNDHNKGINGREIIHALSADPTTWPTVHAFSRSQREPYPPHIHHDTVDLLSSADVIAKQLSAIGISGDKGVDVVFFTAYLQKGDEAEMARTNGSMLRNFLEALRITGAEKALKRVVLTTGAKQYGVHLGPVKNPMEEEDPWLENGDAHGEEVAAGVKFGGGGGFPPNFYYVQQRILVEMSKGKGWDWVVTYPNDVIGVAKGPSIYIYPKGYIPMSHTC